jgi:hypothetical protein
LEVPRNLVATKGDAAINLTWNPVSGATGYKIYYSQNEINASNLGSTPSVQVSNASGSVSGLTNNTLYYFAITAVKDGVEGSQSAMVTATSPIGSPSLDNLSDKYLILNSDITAFAFNNTNSAASSCSSEPSLPSKNNLPPQYLQKFL